MEKKPLIYRIDKNDIIFDIEGPWDEFAKENNGYPKNKKTNIIGNSLWTYIKDFETKHLYKLIIDHVRVLKREITIPIMCDAPEVKRFIDLTIIPLEDGKIEFISNLKKEIKRKKIDLLDCQIPRSEELLKMCSYCKSIKIDEKNWMETTQAVLHLKLFQKPLLPQITHGICPQCYEYIIKELEDYKLAFNKAK